MKYKVFGTVLMSAFLLGACTDKDTPIEKEKVETVEVLKETETKEIKNITDLYEKSYSKVKNKDKELVKNLNDLYKSDNLYISGKYKKGDIPKGDYVVFGLYENGGKEYYMNEKNNENNEYDYIKNFKSFGYVTVQEVGDIKLEGYLVPVKALDELQVKGAKELFEKFNGIKSYNGSGTYLIGKDIKQGEYELSVELKDTDGRVEVWSDSFGKGEEIGKSSFFHKYGVVVHDGELISITDGKWEFIRDLKEEEKFTIYEGRYY